MNESMPITEAVERFLKKTGWKESRLGLKALNDPHSVTDLMKGEREMRSKTQRRLRDFMESYEEKAA